MKEREYTFDVLRVIAMIMVIITDITAIAFMSMFPFFIPCILFMHHTKD